MAPSLRSHLVAAVVGGLVVAGALAVLGLTGNHTTQTVYYQPLTPGGTTGGHGQGLSAHDIYVLDAPAVVLVRAASGGASLAVGAPPQQQASGFSAGSGFLIRGGYVLTSFHVIEGANPSTGITVQFDDAGTRRATVVGANRSDDVALLRVSLAGLAPVKPLALGDSASVKVGDPTLSIANPFGLDRTLSSGIVAALQREIEAQNGFAVANVIETDSPSMPSDSGSPLLNAEGRVIGINSTIATGGQQGSGSIDVSFAVPIDTVEQFMEAAGVPVAP